jgi:outer membrane lipoprotein-sorting protein
MNPLLTRSAAVVSIALVFLFATACRSQSDPAVTNSPSPETVVSSTPPFQTKEPDRYRATRTITTSSPTSETVVTKSSIARDGELRRNEFEAAGKTIVYLEVAQGRFVLLPDGKLYADVANQTAFNSIQNDEQLTLSPEYLLHSEGSTSTSYEKLGREVVAGRNSNKYRVVVNSSTAESVSPSETFIWIDEVLGIPVKSESASPDGTRITMLLSEITLAVDKNLFQVPDDYEKVALSEISKRLTKRD